MPTINKKLESLSLSEINEISEKYLKGWHDVSEYGFRIKGLNNMRKKHGMSELTKDLSLEHRVEYIMSNFDADTIYNTIRDCMLNNLMVEMRYQGIYLFDCRFGPDYVKAFKQLLGGPVYKQLAEECRVTKLTETQTELYGGVGLAGDDTKLKAQATSLERYGVANPMQNDDVKEALRRTNEKVYGGMSPFSSDVIRDKAEKSKVNNVRDAMIQFKKTGVLDESMFKISPWEFIVFDELLKVFDKDDIYYQYGKHPYDARYPFNCDFYIKSQDLFIELNCHYSHGKHWFDETSHDDKLRVQHLLQSDSKKSRLSVKTWTQSDVEKRNVAKDNDLNYLVFWDSSCHSVNKKRIPNLSDFYSWLRDYSCNTSVFLKDNPLNTY